MDDKAPAGKIYVCLACGKTSKTMNGDREAVRRGWDVSCVVNCDLFDESDLVIDQYGKVEEIKKGS